jgi:hypothetical protein
LQGVYCSNIPAIICSHLAASGGSVDVAAAAAAAASKPKRSRDSLDIGYDKKSLQQVFALLSPHSKHLPYTPPPPLSSYPDPLLQLKSLLKARGLPLPPPEQILKENLVAILQACDTDNSTTNDASTSSALAVRNGSLCAPELEQLHLEIIEQAASLRAETIKNPVKSQALRRLTNCLAEMGVSALSSHIPESQLDIKRLMLFSFLVFAFNTLPAPHSSHSSTSLFTTTRVLTSTDRHAIASCCAAPADLGAAEAYFYRAVHAGNLR